MSYRLWQRNTINRKPSLWPCSIVYNLKYFLVNYSFMFSFRLLSAEDAERWGLCKVLGFKNGPSVQKHFLHSCSPAQWSVEELLHYGCSDRYGGMFTVWVFRPLEDVERRDVWRGCELCVFEECVRLFYRLSSPCLHPQCVLYRRCLDPMFKLQVQSVDLTRNRHMENTLWKTHCAKGPTLRSKMDQEEP